MKIFTQILILVLVFVGGVLSVGVLYQADAPDSVEIGISETSPLGPAGGYAVPASGCSGGDCEDVTLTVDNTLVRKGDPVTVCWYLKSHTSCSLGPSARFSNPVPTTDACEDITITGEVVFELICTAPTSLGTKESTKRVRVLPEMYES
jgi:hypothetical protein